MKVEATGRPQARSGFHVVCGDCRPQGRLLRRALLAWAVAVLNASPLWAGPKIFYSGSADVLTHHKHISRDGFYIDPSFTKGAIPGLIRDLDFDGSVVGAVYAQPLYMQEGPNGTPAVFVVTESNNVCALDAISGETVWTLNVGPATPLSLLPCGDINPVGIVGTPVIDPASRTMFFDALITTNGAPKHYVYGVSVDSGAVNPGWPVDVDGSVSFGGETFSSAAQGQRGALTIVNGILYVPYGGDFGDCGTYHGWLVGLPLDDPTNALAWATSANGGGCWGVGGVASDGVNVYIATGNTIGAKKWSGGEAVLCFQDGPVFSGLTNNYWAPANWLSLDDSDLDIGGSGPLLVNVPGASPSSLIASFGKDGNAYLLNMADLGGIGPPLAQTNVSSAPIVQAAATYQTSRGTYVVFSANSALTALRLSATSPPRISLAWSQPEGGRGSPFVTSSDGTNDIVVWGAGCEGDQQLHGFDGDTGAIIFGGGGANEVMTGARRFNTGIVANGRLYFACDNQVFAFLLPAPIVLTDPVMLPGNLFECEFTNLPGLTFTAYATTNLARPFSQWFQVGAVQEIYPGQYEFLDGEATTNKVLFYQVRSQ